MSTPHGSFIWYELLTDDTKAAEAFYRAVIGWQAADSGMSSQGYTLFSAGETPVAGLMTLPREAVDMGARPAWIGYIAVDDVDVFTGRVSQAGGVVYRAPDEVAGVGRFAVVADPQGAAFVLFKGAMDRQRAPAAPGTPGHVGWHELHAADREPAFAFYAGLFGWTKAQAVDLGPMGVYQTFATPGGSDAVGGMMTKVETIPKPFWLYYFNIENIDAAATRVRDAGGQVLHDPHQVPGGSWIVHCLDPQGVLFALVAPPV
jgi:predicted enzyme related to lactoylglutathione lyase